MHRERRTQFLVLGSRPGGTRHTRPLGALIFQFAAEIAVDAQKGEHALTVFRGQLSVERRTVTSSALT